MRLTRAFNVAIDSTLALLYPQQCHLCGGIVSARFDGVACGDCWSSTRIFDTSNSLCWKCGRLTIKPVPVEHPELIRCAQCDNEPFTNARACGVYEGALRASILALKREPYMSRRVVDLLSSLQQRAPLNGGTVIVAVPLHPDREGSRGFNQAAIVARHLSRANRIPIAESSLIRVSQSEQHRAGMDARGRQDTVANAFEVVHPALIGDERVLLVDDVFTTGATVSACASALSAAGAKEVLVLTIARA